MQSFSVEYRFIINVLCPWSSQGYGSSIKYGIFMDVDEEQNMCEANGSSNPLLYRPTDMSRLYEIRAVNIDV